MGDLWLPILNTWGNATKILDAILTPFTTASQLASQLGGTQFLYSVFALASVLYTYWHTKDAYPAGAVGLLLGTAGQLLPELRFVSWLVLAVGAALIIYRMGKEMWG